jgi:hypothetical protein
MLSQLVVMPQDIGIAVNQVAHGLVMLVLEMKPENVIKTVELFSVIMVLRVLVMVVLQ